MQSPTKILGIGGNGTMEEIALELKLKLMQLPRGRKKAG